MNDTTDQTAPDSRPIHAVDRMMVGQALEAWARARDAGSDEADTISGIIRERFGIATADYADVSADDIDCHAPEVYVREEDDGEIRHESGIGWLMFASIMAFAYQDEYLGRIADELFYGNAYPPSEAPEVRAALAAVSKKEPVPELNAQLLYDRIYPLFTPAEMIALASMYLVPGVSRLLREVLHGRNDITDDQLRYARDAIRMAREREPEYNE